MKHGRLDMLLDSAYLQLLTPSEERELINQLPAMTKRELEKVRDAEIGRISTLAMCRLIRLNLNHHEETDIQQSSQDGKVAGN